MYNYHNKTRVINKLSESYIKTSEALILKIEYICLNLCLCIFTRHNIMLYMQITVYFNRESKYWYILNDDVIIVIIKIFSLPKRKVHPSTPILRISK